MAQGSRTVSAVALVTAVAWLQSLAQELPREAGVAKKIPFPFNLSEKTVIFLFNKKKKCPLILNLGSLKVLSVKGCPS